jgi:hypothetical protein
MVQKRYLVGLVALVGLGAAVTSYGATISAGPAAEINAASPATTNTGGVAPGTTIPTAPPPGLLGYDYFTVNFGNYAGPGGDPGQVHTANVTDSNAATPGTLAVLGLNGVTGGYYSSAGYSALNIAGTPSTTGIAYDTTTTAGTPVTIFTVTLGSSVPSSFIMGILDNNTGGVGDNTPLLITGSDGSSQVVNATASTLADASDDFFFVTVTNAAPGQVITVAGENTVGSNCAGGVVFDSVPEPATLSLIGLPLLALASRRRRN